MFHRNQEGANALEFALVLPLLITLIFGGISTALAWDYRLQLNHAAREASRYAATVPTPGSDAFFDEVFERAIGVGAGRLRIADPGLTICVTVVSDSTVSTQRATGDPSFTTVAQFANDGDADPGDTSGQCIADNLSGDRVQVYIQAATSINVVLFSIDPINLSSSGLSLYEPEPTPSAGP